jgi:hypothetical protein
MKWRPAQAAAVVALRLPMPHRTPAARRMSRRENLKSPSGDQDGGHAKPVAQIWQTAT